MAGYFNDKYIPEYYGIQKKAINSWIKLSSKLEEIKFYPCANNPYYYTDYGTKGEPELTDDDCESLCTDCPAIRECYRFAMDNDEENGVWGGINFAKVALEKKGELF